MNIQLKTVAQLTMYLKAKHIVFDDFTYHEEENKENKYGMKEIPAIRNPYLWMQVSNKNLIPAIESLLEYHSDWVSVQLCVAILEGAIIRKDLLPAKIINKLLTLTCVNVKSEEDKKLNLDTILFSIVGLRSQALLEKSLAFVDKHELVISENGVFMKTALTEVSKTGNQDMINYLLDKFPIMLEKCDAWPYLTAIRYGHYKLALFFAKKGLDIHAKNDLGYKLLERNYKNNSVNRVGDTKKFEEELMDLYNMVSLKHEDKA